MIIVLILCLILSGCKSGPRHEPTVCEMAADKAYNICIYDPNTDPTGRICEHFLELTKECEKVTE